MSLFTYTESRRRRMCRRHHHVPDLMFLTLTMLENITVIERSFKLCRKFRRLVNASMLYPTGIRNRSHPPGPVLPELCVFKNYEFGDWDPLCIRTPPVGMRIVQSHVLPP